MSPIASTASGSVTCRRSAMSVATGVSFTDANARFLAYDVLTVLSGLAGALLVAGAFTRWMWPLGVIVGVWFAASIVLGRLYPEVVQRFSVDPNTFAQEERYIANNIAMTRLAFGIDDWEWGVDLFADDPVAFKKLIYEMRFDRASAEYAEFGPFYVGLQFSAAELPALLDGRTPRLGD